MTAELGNVSPFIVVPGTWTAAEIEYWARMLLFAKGQNGGHNCIAAEVIVTDKAWPQREEFLSKVKELMKETPSKWCYYPASDRGEMREMGEMGEDWGDDGGYDGGEDGGDGDGGGDRPSRTLRSNPPYP